VPSLFWRLLQEKKPDVIHTHQYPVFFSDISASVSRLKGIPLLLHVHVVSDAKSPLSGFISDMYYSSLGLSTLRAADTVVVPSLAYKAKLLQMHVNPNKIHLIPYGIDTKKFKNISGEPFRARFNCKNAKIILTVGRLNYQKGFQYLIKAMPDVLRQIPTAKLLIVGEGELLGYLKQLASSLGISQSVIFTGALGSADIPEAYAAADVFVLPSLFESFGIVLIEAQAAGKPVIATRAGGVPEALVKGETGFLVESNIPKLLEASIIRVLQDGDLAAEMGKNGVKFAERFDIHSLVSNVIDSYKKIAN
jgi:glycosyltransferase involved in cell wall biosynthesis